MWGVRGRALSHPLLPALWAGCRGPLPTGFGLEGLRAWGPVTNPTAPALASWLCALWGRHVGARGVASCLGVGRPGSGALPPPAARPLGGLPGPTTHWLWVRGGAGVGTRHKPYSARSFELALRAVGPACGCPRGAPLAWVWGVRSRALSWAPTARPLGGLPGPTTHWLWVRGGAGVGTCHQPHSARSFELALLAVGAALGCRWEGASCLGVGLPGSGALPPPAACPLGGLPGPTTHWLWVRGGAGVGTRHQPDSMRSCELALRVWGRHEGAWGGGGASCMGVGRPGSGALPPSTARPLGGLLGPTTHWLTVRGAAGVGTRHQPHSARSCELALRAVGAARERPGRGASCLGVGRPLLGALPPPTARPVGGLPGPTTHWLWVPGGAGVGIRHQPHSARSFELALRAVGAARGRPGRGASCLGVGRPRSGAVPPPTARPLGGLLGPATHWLWVRGGAGVGTRHQPHCARYFELALRAVGAARGRPGGGSSCLAVGRPGSGALPPPTARPLGGLPGPTTHWLWVRGGAGVGTRHKPHSARSCELALRAVGAA